MYLRFQHFPGVFALDMWWLLKMWRRWCPRLTSGPPGVGGCSDDGQLGALVNPSLSIALSPLGGFQFFA